MICDYKYERLTVVRDESVLGEIGCEHSVNTVFDVESCSKMVIVGLGANGWKGNGNRELFPRTHFIRVIVNHMGILANGGIWRVSLSEKSSGRAEKDQDG